MLNNARILIGSHLTYDLFEDRCIADVIIKKTNRFHVAVRPFGNDHRCRQNVTNILVAHFYGSYHLLTSYVIYY